MKKLIVLAGTFAALAGCRSASTPAAGAPPAPTVAASSVATGAADPRAALTAFLAASEVQDLQALAAVWGDSAGSVRDNIPRDELEKREFTMMVYLKHDKYDILSDAPSTKGSRVFAVQFTCGQRTKSANFDVVQGPSRRWYVEQFDMPALSDLCKKTAGASGRG